MSAQMPEDAVGRAGFLKRLAIEAGFDVARIADPRPGWNAGKRLRHFLDEGRHGDMEWMERTAERRSHPTLLWPEVRSALVVGLNYGPPVDPLERPTAPDRGIISVYARGIDYHELIKKRLKRIGRTFAAAMGADVKVFVDTAPLMEKPLAARAGLGWQGKHTNLVSRDIGSWLFLGSLLTTAELAPDAAETDHCGQCRACLDICPTNAFPAPYQLDARRCVSYLTIEHEGPIPGHLRAGIGNRIFGCDDCLAVCPWNKFARAASESSFHHREESIDPPLDELARLDDAGFRSRFAGSPVKRTGRDRFVRNVLIAIGNSARPELAGVCEERLADRSSMVRGAAIWALSRLDHDRFRSARDRLASRETDADVLAEWQGEA